MLIIRPATPLLLALCLAGGCAVPAAPGGAVTTEEAADVADVGPGGAADSAGLVVDTALGQVHEGHVEVFPDEQALTPENLRGRMVLYRFHVEAGQSFALVLQATDGRLDPQLLLRDPDNFQLADSKQQALLPALRSEDAVAVRTAQVSGSYYAFVSGSEMHSAGDYRLTLIELSQDPVASLGTTNLTVREYAAELRAREDALQAAIAGGGAAEGTNGYVSTTSRDLFDGTLREWAQLRRTVNVVNELRGYFFAALLDASDLPRADAELLDLVARSCAEIWASAASTPTAG